MTTEMCQTFSQSAEGGKGLALVVLTLTINSKRLMQVAVQWR
jgi:hypothetical protein